MFPAAIVRFLPHAMAVLAAVGAAWWGYSAIWNRGHAACELAHQAALAASLERGLEQAREIARQDAEVSEYYERWRTHTETRLLTIREEVAREVPADCRTCALTADGLRLLNEALRGVRAAPADPGQPDGGVPGPAAPPRWQLPGGVRPLGDDRPALLKLRGETQFAGQSFGQP